MTASVKPSSPEVVATRNSLFVALIFGVVSVAATVAFATLVFGENTPAHLNAGIAHFLLGGGIAMILLTVITTIRGQLAAIQDVSAAIAGAIAASVATSLQGSTPDVVFANALAALMAAALLTAIVLVVMGRLRLGTFIRFVPFPVTAGFLAATGWLLLKGGLEVAGGGSHLEILHLDYFFSHTHVNQVVIAAIGGTVAFAVGRASHGSIWVLPGFLVVSVVAFFTIAAIGGATLEELRAHHWLIALPDTPFWELVSLPQSSILEASAFRASAGGILTFVAVSILAMLVTESGLEVALGRDIDVNGEMSRSGLANLIPAVFGAPTSWVEIPSTAAAYRLRAMRVLTGIIAGSILLAAFAAGPALISLFPRVIAGGLLVYLGLELLGEWLWDAGREMPIPDRIVVVAIIASVELFGLLFGMAVGLVASILIFLARYASLDTVRSSMNLGDVHSGTDRSIPEERLLDHHAELALILQLQGFVFFGSAYSVYTRIQQDFAAAATAPAFLVVDMRLVQGIDFSATTTFVKIHRFVTSLGCDLVIVQGSNEVKAAFAARGLVPDRYPGLHFFDGFDESIEWCESAVLDRARENLSEGANQPGNELLDAVFSDVMAGLAVQEEFEDLVELLRPILSPVAADVGAVLLRQHEENGILYFVMGGRIALESSDAEGTPSRLRVLGRWNTIGEVGTYLGLREPFTARVEQPGEILALDVRDLNRIDDDESTVERRLNQLVIHMLGRELVKASQRLALP